MMKYKKKSSFYVVVAALLVLALAACGATGTEAPDADTSRENPEATDAVLQTTGEEGRVYENDGIKLLVPLEYDNLLFTDTARDNMLFSVSEKASMEAAKARGDEYDGAGWLFSIGTVSEDELHKMLCYGMSGMKVFAKDTAGRYYMYYQPTDVRIVRENYDNIEEDLNQWNTLNAWALSVPDSLLTDNPGLSAEKRGNSALDIYLARIAYKEDVHYTLSMTSYGPMEPGDVDPMPYLDRLMNGATFAYDGGEAPDGEYVVLYFPDEDTRFDFFLMGGKENTIRMLWADGSETFYKASFADSTIEASGVMRAWYGALVEANLGEVLETSGFTGVEFVGEWQDEVSQRAMMSVKKTDETGVYDVVIHWGGSYNSATEWRMQTFAGAQDEILSYENGVKVEAAFSEDGTEEDTVIWENGTGYLMFRDGYLTWYDEQETQAADCRFVKVQ